MIPTATTKQMAAMLANAPQSHPAPSFQVMRYRAGDCHLRLNIDEQAWNLAGTREPGSSRTFATIEAAVRQAQAISLAAGHTDDHEWTGKIDSLPAMPAVSVYLFDSE